MSYDNYHHLIQWAASRVSKRKNQNVIIVIIGPTGSGKTYGGLQYALDCAKACNTSFTLKNNMCFSFDKLLDNMDLPENDKPGVPLLFEEVGAVGSGSSSAEWQSKANRNFASYLQTCRHRNQILILTTPIFAFLDKKARSLVHMQITMKGINYAKKFAIIKPVVLQTNVDSGKIYKKYIRIKRGGLVTAIKQAYIPHPPDDITKEYEIEKRKFTDNLKKRIRAVEGPNPNRKPSMKGKLDLDMMYELIRKGLSNTEIAKLMNCMDTTVIYHKHKLKKASLSQNLRQNPLENAVFKTKKPIMQPLNSTL